MLFVLVAGSDAAVTAQFTRVVRNVSLVRPGTAARSARLNDGVSAGAIVRTGPDGRAELSTEGNGVTRLGDNSTLRVGNDLLLDNGALLFAAPRSANYPTIRTGTVAVDGRGATGIIERFGATYLKIMMLQGTARIFVPQKIGESILLKPGQLLIMKPNTQVLADAVDFSIAQLYRTSRLINHDFARLTSDAQIEAEIQKQKADPKLIPTNLIIYGRGTLVTLSNPDNDQTAAKKKKSAKPTPTPHDAAKGQ